MSNWTGKGSKSRVNNHKNYWENFDNIKKVEPAPYKKPRALFLDDVRFPKHACIWGEKDRPRLSALEPMLLDGDWDIVRNYDAFVNYIDRVGIPDIVSFDNDIFDYTESDMTEIEIQCEITMVNWKYSEVKCGANCALYLVGACWKRQKALPKCYIHTANPCAYLVIKEILENGKKQIQV